MSARRMSDEAILKATGHMPEHWFTILDEIAEDENLLRKDIVMRLWKHNEDDLSAWWAQMTTVEWERDRGRRSVNQSSQGTYQVSVQRTFPGTEMAAWDSLVSNHWLEGLTFNEGDVFKVDGYDVTVRAVRPGKLLRLWWQQGDEKSVIEVMLIPTKDKCAIRYRHYDLAEQGDVDIYRARWKDVLADITV